MLMKKIFTLTLALCGFTAAQAQYNLFNAADVDEDGWLWLNTQEKIDKYVGVIDEDNYTVDPNGKVIQMAYANITPDYPATIADPEAYGVDKAGNYIPDEEVNKDELIKGGIILAPSSSMVSMNGGCLVLNLPSCATIGLYISSEQSVYARSLMLTPGYAIDLDDSTEDPWTGHTKSIYSKASMFDVFCSYGHYKWETAATDHGRTNGDLNFVSDGPVYFCLQNCRNRTVYVHAIKVTTPKQESAGVTGVKDSKPVHTEFYNMTGSKSETPGKGVYVKVATDENGNVTRKKIHY